MSPGRPRLTTRGNPLVACNLLIPRAMKRALEIQARKEGISVSALVRKRLTTFNRQLQHKRNRENGIQAKAGSTS